MGVMIDGIYHVDDPGQGTGSDGSFQRAKSTLRHWIAADGSSGFAPEKGRYHLFVSRNCPWAHRTLLARLFFDLEEDISVSVARPRRTDQGWIFDGDGPFSDPLLGASAIHEVYARQRPEYTGRLTVPVLWDKKTEQIVSNESADIIRMLGAFGKGITLCPETLRQSIDDWNGRIYAGFNNGVYRAGFARTQEAYDKAVAEVFALLDSIESHLESSTYLTGDSFTEADLRFFPTLVRFDVAYHYAFRCNLRRLTDYPHLWNYARRIYHMRGVAQTVDFDVYKQGYFSPSEARNPLGIVPAGPIIDWALD
ncbi:MAG: glutathione S-transferase C-terminal domain-containing protein [Pseudomonadota bacterium]